MSFLMVGVAFEAGGIGVAYAAWISIMEVDGTMDNHLVGLPKLVIHDAMPSTNSDDFIEGIAKVRVTHLSGIGIDDQKMATRDVHRDSLLI